MIGGCSLMDEVNHMNMVVSFLYYHYVVHAYFFYMMMLLWMQCNALIGEQITKLLLCRLPKWFEALRYQGYATTTKPVYR